MPQPGDTGSLADALQTGPRLDRIEVVINPASGSVEPGAAEQMEVLLSEAGREAHIVTAAPSEIEAALNNAVAAKPDLLIVLAGDGTARGAASLCGPSGPLVAPLAGGTMNMLPYAIYGKRPWQEALVDILEDGVEKPIGGGQVGDHTFYVAAILGAPALWAHAREAVREGAFRNAIEKAKVAYSRAFSSSSRLNFSLDGQLHQSAQALNLMCPLVSRAMREDDQALEVDALDPHGAGEAFRLGFKALLSEFYGDWRDDPAVTARRSKTARAWASSHIPCLVDGESVRLPRKVDIRFVPGAFRALAPRPQADPQTADTEQADTAATAL